MKKFIFVMLATLMASTVIFSSCDKKKKTVDAPTTVLYGINFDAAIANDYADVTADGSNIYYYESTVKFDKNVGESDTLTVEKVKSVYQAVDSAVVYFYTHTLNEDGTETVEKDTVHDFWVEDCAMESVMKLDLAEAVDRLKQANIIIPNSPLVVLRKPLGPKELESSYYIFGSTHTNFVTVNATTGDVAPIEELFKNEAEESCEE